MFHTIRLRPLGRRYLLRYPFPLDLLSTAPIEYFMLQQHSWQVVFVDWSACLKGFFEQVSRQEHTPSGQHDQYLLDSFRETHYILCLKSEL